MFLSSDRAVFQVLLQSFGGVYVVPSEPFASERSHRRKKKSLLGFLFPYALFAKHLLMKCISAAQGSGTNTYRHRLLCNLRFVQRCMILIRNVDQARGQLPGLRSSFVRCHKDQRSFALVRNAQWNVTIPFKLVRLSYVRVR